MILIPEEEVWDFDLRVLGQSTWGKITVKPAQRRRLRSSAVASALVQAPAVTSRKTSLSWMLFFFFSDFGIFWGMFAVIIQFHPKIYVFNGSVRMDIEVFMFPVSNSSYYMLQQWKFI